MSENTETAETEQQSEETADVLTAISVIAKRLAKKIRMNDKEGESDNGKNE